MSQKEENLLKVSKSRQEQAVEGLMEKSRPSSPYNLLLIFSAVIVACGILMDNAPVIIGGMLVTPLLSPILAISLGISCGEAGLVNRSLWLTLRSIVTVVVIAFFAAFLFPESTGANRSLELIQPDLLYVIVALISGMAATFAWTNRDINDALPGVAVAVSIVPPLSALGIGIGSFSIELTRASLVVFSLNFLGISMGSLLVFSLQQFYKTKRETHKRVVEESRELEKKKKKKEDN